MELIQKICACPRWSRRLPQIETSVSKGSVQRYRQRLRSPSARRISVEDACKGGPPHGARQGRSGCSPLRLHGEERPAAPGGSAPHFSTVSRSVRLPTSEWCQAVLSRDCTGDSDRHLRCSRREWPVQDFARILEQVFLPRYPGTERSGTVLEQGIEDPKKLLCDGMADIFGGHIRLAGIPSGDDKDDLVQVEPFHRNEPAQQMSPVERVRGRGEDPNAQLPIHGGTARLSAESRTAAEGSIDPSAIDRSIPVRETRAFCSSSAKSTGFPNSPRTSPMDRIR